MSYSVDYDFIEANFGDILERFPKKSDERLRAVFHRWKLIGGPALSNTEIAVCLVGLLL